MNIFLITVISYYIFKICFTYKSCRTTRSRHSSWWSEIANAIFASTACKTMHANLLDECYNHGEFRSLSVDATFKVCFSILGQAKFNRHRRLREKQAIPDEAAKYRVLTVRGSTSAVVLTELIHDEKPGEVILVGSIVVICFKVMFWKSLL